MASIKHQHDDDNINFKEIIKHYRPRFGEWTKGPRCFCACSCTIPKEAALKFGGRCDSTGPRLE